MLVNKGVLSILHLSLVCFTATLYAADEAMIQSLAQAAQGKVNVSIHNGTGKVRFLSAPAGRSIAQPFFVPSGADAETAATGFLSAYGGLFGITSSDQELMITKAKSRMVKFKQVYEGIPVIGGELVVHLDARQNILSVNGEVSPDVGINTTPAVTPIKAKARALAVVSKKHRIAKEELAITDTELSIFNPVLIGHNEKNMNHLVWRFEVKSRDGSIREFVLIDAHNGIPHLSFNQVDTALNRTIYDNQNYPWYDLPGFGPVSTEGGGASATQDVNNVYDFLGDTYDFYWSNHGRDSIDGLGMELIATVRYCDPDLPWQSPYCPYRNAFWNGDQLVFGEGFVTDDIVAHELTHGVTEHESGLFYYMQSGAINESLSDIWGEFIDLMNIRGTDTPDTRWLIGEDIQGYGILRSLKNPPRFYDPDSMVSPLYYCRSRDGGGVHTNSGVNNKAAYLMVDGGTFNGQIMTGVSGASDLEKIQKVAKLYYRVQTHYLTSGSDYQDLADALIQACDDLQTVSPHVMTSADCSQVEKAVNAVHMHSLPTRCKNIDVPLCPDGVATDIFFDDLENPESGNWARNAVMGSNTWYYPQNPNLFTPYGFDATYATSSLTNFWGYDYGGTMEPFTGKWNFDGESEYYITMTPTAQNLIGPLPANAFMMFKHSYDFERGAIHNVPTFFDGGVLEYSIDNGSTWIDAGSLFIINGYDGKLDTRFGNPLSGRKAFGGSSHGYITSKLDLATLAGKSVRFRFGIGTDSFGDDLGWFLDDIRIVACSAPAPAAMAFSSSPGGQALKNGDAVTLGWKGPANLSYAKLLYTVDGGITWRRIDSNLSGNTYTWIMPLMANNKAKAKVKVIGYNDKGATIGSVTSGFFTIEVVRLTSPNGGESNWNEGDNRSIEWISHVTKTPVTKVQLFYSIDKGITWKPISTDNINDGSFEWTLPQVKTDKTTCKVKIVLKDAKGNIVGSDVSDAVFTIHHLP